MFLGVFAPPNADPLNQNAPKRAAHAASDSVRNYYGLTPLVLAAQLGNTAMLQHVYNRRRRAFYTFGKVGA